MAEDIAAAMPSEISVAGFDARIFKLPALTKYHQCGDVGHRATDSKCPGKAPAEIAATVEPIRGGHHPLSNLHTCPKGCTLPDSHYDCPTAKHHYQFKHLQFHRELEQTYHVLEANTGFQAMKVLPEEKVKPD